MAEQKSMALEIMGDMNSVMFDATKTALEQAIKDGTWERSLGTKFVGIKFGIIGNVDKAIKITIALPPN